MVDIKDAKKNVVESYKMLQPIVDEVVKKHSKEIDKIIDKIHKNLSTLTNKELQDLMLQLSAECYFFSNYKDMSILKQELALSFVKSSQAEVYNSSVGTQQARNNQAIVDTLDKQTVNILYNAVANSMKSKLDEAHRMCNILSNVLISKNAEAKLKGIKDDEQQNLYNNNGSEN